MRSIGLLLTMAMASLAFPSTAAKPAPLVNAGKAARLNAAYEQYWEERLELDPVLATYQGDRRYNDRLPDFLSPRHRREEHGSTARWLRKVRAIGPEGLQGVDLVSYQVFVRDAELALEAERFPEWMLPVNQFYSFPQMFAQLGSGTGAQPFRTVEDYDDWLARAHRMPAVFDTAIANMRSGMKAGVVQSRALVEKVVSQLEALLGHRPEDTLFWGPVERMPRDFPAAERERLTNAYREVIDNDLQPAYRKLRDFMAGEYLASARSTAGLGDLPEGATWYARRVRAITSTDLTPDTIHDLGLAEVARIHGEIRTVMEQVGFKGSLQAFFRFMQTDPRFSFGSEEELLTQHRALEARVSRRISEQFSLIPKSSFEVRLVEPFRAASAASGEYVHPSEDGTRPGIFYVNTQNLPTRRTWAVEDLFLHEAIPGHHFQLALQQELTGLPKFRRFGRQTAFTEGWALYAESLGRDLGVYTDPYSCFGRLHDELWRAIRLVVDTGLHAKGWTRERAIDYMLANSAQSRSHATAETERYMAIPGQALAYKIGEMKIRELRERAEKALGDAFDVREFHAEVLKDGAVPLSVLEGKVDHWIASKKG